MTFLYLSLQVLVQYDVKLVNTQQYSSYTQWVTRKSGYYNLYHDTGELVGLLISR